MSRGSYPSYQKPAAVLALMVHGGFFALLYFGFTWQTQTPVAMSVELWQALPDMAQPVVAVPPPAPPTPKVEPAPPVPSPVEVVKPDIVLAIKKSDKKVVEATAAPVIAQPKTRAPAKPEAPSIADLAAARELATQAAQAAAVKGVIDEAMSKNRLRFIRHIRRHDDIAANFAADFAHRLIDYAPHRSGLFGLRCKLTRRCQISNAGGFRSNWRAGFRRLDDRCGFDFDDFFLRFFNRQHDVGRNFCHGWRHSWGGFNFGHGRCNDNRHWRHIGQGLP